MLEVEHPQGGSQEKLASVPDLETASDFEQSLSAWFPLTFALNNINRGLGLPDLYPFMLSDEVIGKLKFIHEVIGRAVSAADGKKEGQLTPRTEPTPSMQKAA